MQELTMKIKLRRISLRLSQDELAQRVGITQQEISNIERGTREYFTINDLVALATALEVTPSWFFEDEESQPA